MGFYESAAKPLLFRLDPERAHSLGFWFIRHGLVRARPSYHRLLRQTLFGVYFQSPLGLAAGFDKSAQALAHWHQLGFGFVEVGTVTAQPQPGNPKPRLFRLPRDQALINRMGFNNEGAHQVSRNISTSNPQLPYGINIGKSRTAPFEQAAKDYQEAFRSLHSFGAYFAINVSSPNTPGLTELQEKGPLLEIIHALREVNPDRPLFVKVSPDLDTAALDRVIEAVHEANLTGLIATNTTALREGLRRDPRETGGLSGRPLKHRALDVLSHLYKSCNPNVVLIWVGGIMDGDDLYERIAHGANLCQVYTSWVYRGPSLVPLALRRLVTLMERKNLRSIDALRGIALR
ncbi:MAG: quinone-dependent dihydroorotate dehydrogenase [Fimbriimonas ginsengisoli]|nr:quinone-dependent dihydroorotate dehydrogenase [Fimbriimonas ginsengisoli]